MKEKLPVTLEDLMIEERVVSAQLTGIRREIKDRQPDNMSAIRFLQGRHKSLMGEVREVHKELDKRWKNEIGTIAQKPLSGA